MKKLTLLFLALSAVAFANTSITRGSNSRNAPTEATIDVHVTAIITDVDPEFVITDSEGNHISDIYFNHEGTVESIIGTPLTNTIYAKGSTLSSGTMNKLTSKFGTSSLELTNGIEGANLTSTLSTTDPSYDSKLGAKYEVSSTLSGSASAESPYVGNSTTLTITYDKTGK
ncbi:hypothetical protein [Cetobacterium sp.]|uniref:hypothetical protein n=1 Tax=Cetobacterium sp. TaxID=2071632 RepID=UPI003F2F5AA1